MNAYSLLRGYAWWILGFIAAVLLSISLSAEFGWDAVSDEPRSFFKEWAIDWVPALATVVVATVVLQQVRLIRRGQKIEYAPVLRLDLEMIPGAVDDPTGNRYAAPFEDDLAMASLRAAKAI